LAAFAITDNNGLVRKRKLTKADLRFISENMRLSGFSGHISPEIATYKPDMDAISRAAGLLGAQQPNPKLRAALKKRLKVRWPK
jgi:hypothetical protein